MTRTCIICGRFAGSAEHIFPAALGGQRKNKSIYCDEHNTCYSGLVSLLASQLEALNSLIEVKSDRTKEVRPAKTTEVETGLPMKLVGGKAQFPGSRIIDQQEQADGSVVQHHSLNSKKEAWAKVDEMRERGHLIHNEKPTRTSRIVGQLHQKLEFGSDEGLRAAGYILQTYLAQEFPQLARSTELDAFKAYTLGLDSTPRTRWDFTPPEAYPANAFKFGHQVLLGVDPTSRTIYGRLSFFSTISFAAVLGQVAASDEPLKTVVIDIDPLAHSQPHDQVRTEHPPGAFMPAVATTNELETAIKSGAVQQAFGRLLASMEEELRNRQAQGIVDRLQAKSAGTEAEKEAVLTVIQDELLQRAFSLAGHIVEGLKNQPGGGPVVARLAELLRIDDSALHGTSDEGFQALQESASALTAELRQDWTAGRIVLDDVAMLIGGGRGAAIVGRVLLTKYAGVPI